MEKIYNLLLDIQQNKTNWVGSILGSSFEELVSLRLSQKGFSKMSPNELTTEEKTILKEKISYGFISDDYTKEYLYKNILIDRFPNGYFICQPFGSQEYPDIIVSEDNALLAIENKKAKGVKPMWNGGLPKPSGLYLIMSTELKDITFFVGNTIISNERFNALKCIRNDILKVVKEHEKMMDILGDDPRGFVYYPRAAFDQHGGKEKTDYFAHKDRLDVEKNTIHQIKELVFIV